MKTWKVVVLLAIAALLLVGCGGSQPPAEPEPTPEDTAEMPERAEPEEPEEEPGLQRGRGDVEDLEALGLRRIHFDTDKWNIREDAREILKKNAEILKEHPDLNIVIEGHCDERNTEEYNLALGERRAEATKDYLVKLGVDADRIFTISYGEERPIAFGHDEESWQKNRRAEFKAKS